MSKILKVTMTVIALLVVVGYGTFSWLTQPPKRAIEPVITGVHYIGMTVSSLEKSQMLYHNCDKFIVG